MKELHSQSCPVLAGDLPAGAHLCSCKQAAEGGVVIPPDPARGMLSAGRHVIRDPD